MNNTVPLIVKHLDSSVRVVNDVHMAGYIHSWSEHMRQMLLLRTVALKKDAVIDLFKGEYLSYREKNGTLVPVCGGE